MFALYIYSPLLKDPEHLNRCPSHLGYYTQFTILMNNYEMNKMEKTAWMSFGLDTVKNI
jgi:hypothetical protein